MRQNRKDRKFQDPTCGAQMGIVVDHLMAATSLIHTELPLIDSLIKKAAMVQEMSTTDIKKVFFKINILILKCPIIN